MTPDELRAHLAQPRIADYLDRMLSDAPALTEGQRVRLAELLRPVRQRFAAEQRRRARREGAA